MRAAALFVSIALAPAAGATAALADADSKRAAVIRDARIPESSALAVSTRSPGLLYTVNDSGNAPVVYAVSRRSGRVVGTTTLEGVEPVDTEALAIGEDQRLYVADIGDNDGVRDAVAVYAIDQPGRRDVTATPQTYVVRYADGPHDAEALIADPVSGGLTILTKGLLTGAAYRLPADLDIGGAVTAERVTAARLPGLVTDGVALADGRRVVVRTYTQVLVYRVPGWRSEASAALPRQRQGESLALTSDGRHLLVGTEGLPSPLLLVPIPSADSPRPPPSQPAPSDSPLTAPRLPAWVVGLGTVVLGGAWLAVRRGQRRRATT